MIAKILSTRSDCRHTIRYAFGQTDQKQEYQSEQAYFLTSNGLTIPDPTVKTRTKDGQLEVVQVPTQEADLSLIFEDFESQASKNTRAYRPYWHCVISVAPGDERKLGDRDIGLREVASDFMDRMGYSDCAWVATVHRDTDHTHIHLAACTVQEAPGHPVVKRYNEYDKAMKACRKIELAHGLQVTPMPADGKTTSDAHTNPALQEIRQILDFCLLQELQAARPTLPGYLDRVQDCGVDVSIRWRQGWPSGASFGFKNRNFSGTKLRAGGRYQLKNLMGHLDYTKSMHDELEEICRRAPVDINSRDALSQNLDVMHHQLRKARADTDSNAYISLTFEEEEHARAFASHAETPLPDYFIRQRTGMWVLFYATEVDFEEHERQREPLERLIRDLIEMVKRIICFIFGITYVPYYAGIDQHPGWNPDTEPVATELDLDI